MRIPVSLAGALALLVSVAPAASAQSEPCSVRRVVGAVEAARNDRSLPLAAGAAVRAGDVVVTAPGGKVEIACADGSVLTIGPESRLELRDLAGLDAEPGGSTVLHLLRGIVRLVVSSVGPRDRFELVAPTAVASVRSTEWLMIASPATAGVFVRDGLVLVSARDGGASVLLQPGFGTDVAAAANPSVPVRWGAARIAAAIAQTTM